MSLYKREKLAQAQRYHQEASEKAARENLGEGPNAQGANAQTRSPDNELLRIFKQQLCEQLGPQQAATINETYETMVQRQRGVEESQRERRPVSAEQRAALKRRLEDHDDDLFLDDISCIFGSNGDCGSKTAFSPF